MVRVGALEVQTTPRPTVIAHGEGDLPPPRHGGGQRHEQLLTVVPEGTDLLTIDGHGIYGHLDRVEGHGLQRVAAGLQAQGGRPGQASFGQIQVDLESDVYDAKWAIGGEAQRGPRRGERFRHGRL
jgi:hypothetical protein